MMITDFPIVLSVVSHDSPGFVVLVIKLSYSLPELVILCPVLSRIVRSVLTPSNIALTGRVLVDPIFGMDYLLALPNKASSYGISAGACYQIIAL